MSERSRPEKAAYCTFPVVRHSGGGRTAERVKGPVVTSVREEGGMTRWSTRDVPQDVGRRNYALHLSSHICQNPQNVHHLRGLRRKLWILHTDDVSALVYGLQGVLTEGRLCICEGNGVYGKSLCLLLSFAANLKLL